MRCSKLMAVALIRSVILQTMRLKAGRSGILRAWVSLKCAVSLQSAGLNSFCTNQRHRGVDCLGLRPNFLCRGQALPQDVD